MFCIDLLRGLFTVRVVAVADELWFACDWCFNGSCVRGCLLLFGVCCFVIALLVMSICLCAAVLLGLWVTALLVLLTDLVCHLDNCFVVLFVVCFAWVVMLAD